MSLRTCEFGIISFTFAKEAEATFLLLKWDAYCMCVSKVRAE